MPDHSEEKTSEPGSEVPFFPNVLLAEVSFAISMVGLLVVFVALFPLRLAEKYDPTNPPTVLEPEWYFMGIYQFLKTQYIEPLYGIVLMVILGVFLLLVPFVDRGPERRPLRRPAFTSIALLVIVEFLALTIYGYLTPGQVGTFSDIGFVSVFLATNIVAVGLVALVFAVHRLIVRDASI